MFESGDGLPLNLGLILSQFVSFQFNFVFHFEL